MKSKKKRPKTKNSGKKPDINPKWQQKHRTGIYEFCAHIYRYYCQIRTFDGNVAVSRAEQRIEEKRNHLPKPLVLPFNRRNVEEK